MDRQGVSSSDIRSIGYDKISMTLEIQFISGGIYQYYNVPETIHLQLMMAPSHGKYFHAQIKDVYQFNRIM